jgi:PhnB protein
MSEIKIPNGHQMVMPYLILPNAKKFYDFVKDVFDAKEVYRGLTDDGEIMHGEVNIGGSVIMYGQARDPWSPQPAGLYVYSKNGDETFRKAIEKGAKVVMEMEDKSYGRSGGVEDPFGNTWWITTIQE